MNTQIRRMWVSLCGILAMTPIVQARTITQAEALEIAQQQFQDRDVDYYIQESGKLVGMNMGGEWKIFVDAEPMKGWEHDCYLLTIPKNVLTDIVPVSTTPLTLPPSSGNYVPLLVTNRYGINANSKPIFSSSSQVNEINPAANRTYAIILSGGVNKYSNYERYWNDCSFIYQTLTNKYGIPKGNIYPIMSDGNNPAADMKLAQGGFVSQPLDLDNDGVADIGLSASKTNVQNTLDTLYNKITEDDHLFLFVIDHGGSDDKISESYICLWGNEKLYDHELAAMLTPFTDKYANVNVVLGQCYSGGFIDDLTKVGCVVAAACTGSEYSWSCTDFPYDEFVYHWTSAVNQRDHLGRWVSSNVDYDGLVTMDEAFAYAAAHDRAAEHPQYVSTPVSVGEDLAFNHLAPAVNLFVKDDPEDEGREPNCTSLELWKSPSIWVRNRDDGGTEHENPYYSADHVASTIYVRVFNRGKKDYYGGSQYVHAYWAKAATGFVPQTWMGGETYTNGEVTGGPVNIPSVIDTIRSGESRIVKLTWALPVNMFGNSPDNETEKHHFCLLTKVMDTHIEPWYTGTFSYNLWKSNKDAQKNVSIINRGELSKGTIVFVRNVKDTIQSYTLELIPRSIEDESIFTHADVFMEMSQPIYDAWERGGSQANNINQVPAMGTRTVRFLNKESRLEAISLAGQEFDKVSLKFNFKTMSINPRYYALDLIQKDENGNIIGGETFIVEEPNTAGTMIPITSTPIGDGKYQLEADVDDNETVRWENNEGAVIGNTDTVEVSPNNGSDQRYYVYALSENGDLSSGSIQLDSETGIERITVDAARSIMNVYLKGDVTTGSSLMISSVSAGEGILYRNLSNDDNTITFNVSELPQGIYTVTYVKNGAVIDSAKFSR